MELACERFVIGDREKGRVEGRKKRGKKGGKNVMKEERNQLKQIERKEDICSNKIHNNLNCKT
jgi:hypothetical protein